MDEASVVVRFSNGKEVCWRSRFDGFKKPEQVRDCLSSFKSLYGDGHRLAAKLLEGTLAFDTEIGLSSNIRKVIVDTNRGTVALQQGNGGAFLKRAWRFSDYVKEPKFWTSILEG